MKGFDDTEFVECLKVLSQDGRFGTWTHITYSISNYGKVKVPLAHPFVCSESVRNDSDFQKELNSLKTKEKENF
jgi:hypothetical protein